MASFVDNTETETSEEVFERRQAQLSLLLIAIENCTLPDVRMKVEKDIRLLIATQVEEARQNCWQYTAPVISGPKKPSVKFVYPTVVVEYAGDRELCNIVLTENLVAWQAHLFCFFTGLQITTAKNAASALLLTDWNAALAVVREFRIAVTVHDLAEKVDLQTIFEKLDPIREVQDTETLAPLRSQFPEYGDGRTFVVATSAEVSAVIWKFGEEHLIAFSKVNGFIGVFAGVDMQRMLGFLDGYFSGFFRNFVVVKKSNRVI